MPSFPTWLLPARYGSLVVAIVALSVADGSLDTNLAQSAHAQGNCASQSDSMLELADGWRRTVHGWEKLALDRREAAQAEVPTQHVGLAQVWPAAWAACVTLSVLGLAAAGAERKEINACLADGDEISYDLSRAAR